MDSFMTALSCTSMLFLFIASGYILRKREILKAGSERIIAPLLMHFIQPLMIIHIMTKNVTADNLKSTYPVFLLACIILISSYFIGKTIAKILTKKPDMRRVITFALVYSNFGFMGIPIIESVYGSGQFAYLIIYTLPYYLSVNVFGEYILSKEKKFNPKIIFQPTTYAIALGFVLIFLGIKPSGPIARWIESSYNCVVPLSMILAGVVLSKRKISEMFSSLPVYIVTLLRTIVFPLIVLVIMKLLGYSGAELGTSVLIMGMPVAANSVMLSEQLDTDSFSAAQLVFISTAFSLVSIPILTFILSL